MVLPGKGTFIFAVFKADFYILYIIQVMKSYYVAEYVAKMGEQHTTFGWENLKGK
jgi:hypothetical protein